jgi:hypothetical protein
VCVCLQQYSHPCKKCTSEGEHGAWTRGGGGGGVTDLSGPYVVVWGSYDQGGSGTGLLFYVANETR